MTPQSGKDYEQYQNLNLCITWGDFPRIIHERHQDNDMSIIEVSIPLSPLPSRLIILFPPLYFSLITSKRPRVCEEDSRQILDQRRDRPNKEIKAKQRNY